VPFNRAIKMEQVSQRPKYMNREREERAHVGAWKLGGVIEARVSDGHGGHRSWSWGVGSHAHRGWGRWLAELGAMFRGAPELEPGSGHMLPKLEPGVGGADKAGVRGMDILLELHLLDQCPFHRG
jgi:hypothetical protein